MSLLLGLTNTDKAARMLAHRPSTAVAEVLRSLCAGFGMSERDGKHEVRNVRDEVRSSRSLNP
jgi:hypothetical protein